MSVLLIAGWLALQCAPLETKPPHKLQFFGWPMVLLMPYPIEDEFGGSVLGTQWQWNGVFGNLLFLLDLFQRQVAQLWASAKRHLRLLKMESSVALI